MPCAEDSSMRPLSQVTAPHLSFAGDDCPVPQSLEEGRGEEEGAKTMSVLRGFEEPIHSLTDDRCFLTAIDSVVCDVLKENTGRKVQQEKEIIVAPENRNRDQWSTREGKSMNGPNRGEKENPEYIFGQVVSWSLHLLRRRRRIKGSGSVCGHHRRQYICLSSIIPDSRSPPRHLMVCYS